jgi:hypothetical protein
MTSLQVSPKAELLCFGCALESKLRVLIPCSLHRLQSSNPESAFYPSDDPWLRSASWRRSVHLSVLEHHRRVGCRPRSRGHPEKAQSNQACTVSRMTIEGGSIQVLEHFARDLWIVRSKPDRGQQLNIPQQLWFAGYSDLRAIDKVFALVGVAPDVS